MTSSGRAQDRRAQLLTAGKEIFARGLYEDVSAQEIAEHAGVAYGLVFHYFGSKRDFFMASLEHVTDDAFSDFERNTERDPVQWLRNETDIFLINVTKNSQLFAALIHGSLAAESEVREILARLRGRAAERVLEKLEPTHRSGLLVNALTAWTACVNELGAQWLESGRRIPRRDLQRLMGATLNATLRAAADPG